MKNKCLFTTVQNNGYVREMTQVMIKSFLLYNNDWDIKVYCLDNSKDIFQEDLKDLPNVEIINFRDNTIWYNKLIKYPYLLQQEFTKLGSYKEATNPTSVLSKLEILDILQNSYKYVFMSDIDIIFLNSINYLIHLSKISNATVIGYNEFCKESKTLINRIYLNAGHMLFNTKSENYCKSHTSIASEILKNGNLDKFLNRPYKYCEQDILHYIYHDNTTCYHTNKIRLRVAGTQPDELPNMNDYLLIHYLGKHKPYIKYDNNIHSTFSNFYYNLRDKLKCIKQSTNPYANEKHFNIEDFNDILTHISIP